MNANEYINGMADLIRTTGADVSYAPLVLERAIEYRMDFVF